MRRAQSGEELVAESFDCLQWPFNIWATPFLTNYHFDKVRVFLPRLLGFN